MVKVFFPQRLLVDEHFLRFVADSKNESVYSQMRRIKAGSLDHPRCHTVILEPDFASLVADNSFAEDDLSGYAKRTPLPDFVSGDDTITRNIRYAVFLSNQKPYSTIILTSKEHRKSYLDNRHLVGLDVTINVLADQEALGLLAAFNRSFELTREQQRIPVR